MQYGILGGLNQQNIRRNVFISYYHGDQIAVNDFVKVFGRELGVFIPNMLAEGQGFSDDIINSTNPQYVMQEIRRRYFGHSTVTIVLIGNCTHSRRYVDWEIKASLQKGGIGGQLPHGLMAINLCKANNEKSLPPRLSKNLKNDGNGYGFFYRYPNSPQELKRWIEDAFKKRKTHSNQIVNPNEMMKYNSRCKVCRVTH